MDPGRDKIKGGSCGSHGPLEGAPLRTENLAPLFTDFPDPVWVADCRGEVRFLNRAAQDLFGETLQVGDRCPICAQISGGSPASAWITQCLGNGEVVNRVPVSLRTKGESWGSFHVSTTPIKDNGDRPSGCLVVLRELLTDLLTHPTAQLMMATLSSIMENFPNPFFMVNPELVITHINEPMERLTGFSRGEVVGKMTCGEVLQTVQCFTADCVLKQVLEHKKPISGWRRVVRNREGREIQVVVSAAVITDPAGRVIGGFETVRDITPIVEAEKKIELLTELTQEGILMADENHRILFANSRMAEIVGRPKEELIGQSLKEILTVQHQERAEELLRLADAEHLEESQFCSSLDHLKSQDEPRVFETCMAAARMGQNSLTCVYLRDLTYRLKMHEQLHKTNIFLNNIIRSSFDGIVVVDTKGNPLIFSKGAEEILGYKAEDVIANPEVFHRFYPVKLAKEVMRRLRSDRYGPPGKLNPTRISLVSKSGEEVPVNFSASLIYDRGEVVGSVGIFTDLREHLKIQKELEWSQIMQAEKITSLGRLSAGVAHEINNPLAGILIYAELLQRQMQEGDQNRQHVEEIINQTLRCQQIVKRLLEFTRKSMGQIAPFDVNDTINRCVELISHQAFFHNIEIVQDLDPGLPQIMGDSGQIQQLFTNLLINAADAMNGQGRITITSRPASKAKGVVLTLSDTGKGIPPEMMDRIFEPFFTTKPVGTGTGLGLAIVHRIVYRHGGSIEVESPPGGGTTFTIRLPLEPPRKKDQTE